MSQELPDVPDTPTGGKSIAITMPTFQKWGVKKTLYDYSAQIVDYESLETLNRTINAARLALFETTEQINRYERLEREAKIQYDRRYRRAYLQSMEKTETAKKARAELACEDIENEYVAHEQMKNELIRVSHVMRLELQTLQSLGNNLRQQMKME